jgi:site-specific recombinase XerD
MQLPPMPGTGVSVIESGDAAPEARVQRHAMPPASAEVLDRLADALDRNAIAKNTVRGYRSDWTSWLVFCGEQGIQPLPAEPENVRRYLAQLTEVGGRTGKKLKPKTGERHLAAVAAAHRAANLVFDTSHPLLKKTLNGIRRTYGEAQKGAKALRTGDIVAMCKGLSLDLRSVRNRAIILLGFAGGFRRSEIVALNVADLEFPKKGGLLVRLQRSKTDQTGKGRMVGIALGTNPDTCPVTSVQAWLNAAELKGEGNDALFRPVNRWGAVELTRLSDKAVDRIVKKACEAAGLKVEGYSAHSLRAGHVTEALASGADRASVKRQTGHASDGMLDRYAREAELFNNNSSGNLGL